MVAGTPHGMNDVVLVIFEFGNRLVLLLIVVVGSISINLFCHSSYDGNEK